MNPIRSKAEQMDCIHAKIWGLKNGFDRLLSFLNEDTELYYMTVRGDSKMK